MGDGNNTACTGNNRKKDDETNNGIDDAVRPHSLAMGQFALLVKKDCHYNNDYTNSQKMKKEPNDITTTTTTTSSMNNNNKNNNNNNNNNNTKTKKKKSIWPLFHSDKWCPPGTTIPLTHQSPLFITSSSTNNNNGSTSVNSSSSTIHTCSDKICRWNCLGLQGSLLSSLICGGETSTSTNTNTISTLLSNDTNIQSNSNDKIMIDKLKNEKKEVTFNRIVQQQQQQQQQPVYLSSIVVGRKFASSMENRAICCRAVGFN